MSTTTINPTDIKNVIFGARAGLRTLDGIDLVNVSTSIANLEHALRDPGQATPAPVKAEATPVK